MKIWEVLLKLMLALILSGIIGMEREQRHKAAGLKTHILVGVSSALVMLMGDFLNIETGGNVDVSRMAAQVVSGVGFLGAGTIMMRGGNISGLTTAASIWAVACLGLACGAGFYWGAFLGAMLIFITLTVINNLLKNLSENKNIAISVKAKEENIKDIVSDIHDLSISVAKASYSSVEEGQVTIQLNVKLPEDITTDTVIGKILSIKGVQEVTRM